MHVREIGFDEFFDSKHIWEEALEKSLDNNIFQTWEWLTTWWKHYGEKRRFSLIAVFEGGKILAAAP